MRTFEESWGFQDGVTGNSEQQGPSPSLTQELSGALGCLGPSPCPSRAPQLPGRTMRTLEVACRVHTHPALPLSNMPPPPTPRAQHRDRGTPQTGPQQVEGRQGPSFQQPSICHPAHPPSSTSAEVTPSFPQIRPLPPLPRPARSRPFFFSPQAQGPIPLGEAALPEPEGPSLHLPSPGAGQQGQYPLQNWPLGPSRRREERGRDGPQRSVFLVPASPLVRAEDPWALCHSRCYSYRPLPKDGKTHEGNRPRRQGRDAGLRDPGPSRAPSPLRCALPPAGGGKPRSSHIRENRPTKCDQTQ